jgi:predicted phosphodiesterase
MFDHAPVVEIEARKSLLIFGGPYSNLEATQAVLAESGRLGIPRDHVLCTGDIVAYCGDPLATAALIRDSGIAVIMGNCEEQLAAGEDDCGCGFSDEMLCHALSREWYRFATLALDDATRAWMGGLPRHLVVAGAGRRLAVVHGSPSQINQFVFASTPYDQKVTELAGAEVDGIICGHSGLPFTQIIEGQLWHNAGVIGIPANDGTTSTWYSLLTLGVDEITIEHRRLHYDHCAASARMRRVGLSHHYADALLTGLWPSLDILPATERACTGRAIRTQTHRWTPGPPPNHAATGKPKRVEREEDRYARWTNETAGHATPEPAASS